MRTKSNGAISGSGLPWSHRYLSALGRRVSVTCGTIGQLKGKVWWVLYALEVQHLAIVCHCWFASLERGFVEKLSLQEALERASHPEEAASASRGSSASVREAWLQCQVKHSTARVLGILMRSTGDACSHICSEKIMYVLDLGHNTQKLLRGGKQHRNLLCLLPRGP